MSASRDRPPLRIERWLTAYLAGPPDVRGNATAAAHVAGYSPKAARVAGARLKQHPYVRQVLARKLANLGVAGCLGR